MGYLLSLSDLKKVIAVGTIFSIVATLAPASAQAIRIGKASGSSINASSFNFDVVTVDDVTKDDESLGFFPEAIQDFNTGSLNNVSICGNSVCPPGNVTVTKLRTDPASGNVLNLNLGSDNQQISLKQLQEKLSAKLPINFNFESNDVVKYDVIFGSSSKPNLIFFIQSNDSNLINDLSTLSRFTDTQIPGFFPSLVTSIDDGSFENSAFEFSLQFPSQLVPEPEANTALLGVGVLGVVLLMKGNKRLKKSVEHKKHQL
jgi:hypothetical protein